MFSKGGGVGIVTIVAIVAIVTIVIIGTIVIILFSDPTPYRRYGRP
jgi:hypothetical protein